MITPLVLTGQSAARSACRPQIGQRVVFGLIAAPLPGCELCAGALAFVQLRAPPQDPAPPESRWMPATRSWRTAGPPSV